MNDRPERIVIEDLIITEDDYNLKTYHCESKESKYDRYKILISNSAVEDSKPFNRTYRAAEIWEELKEYLPLPGSNDCRIVADTTLSIKEYSVRIEAVDSNDWIVRIGRPACFQSQSGDTLR